MGDDGSTSSMSKFSRLPFSSDVLNGILIFAIVLLTFIRTDLPTDFLEEVKSRVGGGDSSGTRS